jgi:hypothetical protein
MTDIITDRSRSRAAHRSEVAYEHLAPDVRHFLIAGSRKVADHYKRLIANTNDAGERQLYIDRIARESRAIQALSENGGYAG